MIVRRGVHAALEREADELLRQSLVGVTKHSEKADILTPWKQGDRYRREVYVTSGTPDSGRKGNFHRSANAARPDLNSREGTTRSSNRRTSGLREHVQDYYGDHGD